MLLLRSSAENRRQALIRAKGYYRRVASSEKTILCYYDVAKQGVGTRVGRYHNDYNNIKDNTYVKRNIYCTVSSRHGTITLGSQRCDERVISTKNIVHRISVACSQIALAKRRRRVQVPIVGRFPKTYSRMYRKSEVRKQGPRDTARSADY